MAYGIPNVGLPMDSLDKGFANINDLFNRLREHALKQQQMVNDAKYRGESLKISRQQQERLAQLLGPQLQELADKHKRSQPGYKAQQVLETLKMMGVPFAGSQQSGQGDVTNLRANPAIGNVPMNINDQNQMPNDPNTGILNGEHTPMDNGGMTEEELNAPPVEDNAPPPHQLDLNNPAVQMALAANGIHIPISQEAPQAKEAREIRTNEAKLNQKESFEKQKEERKIKMDSEKDIPHLTQSLKAIQQLKKIANENPDLFGHYVAPDLWAKTTKNKNAGIFQNLLADQVAGLESKLSSKGNIVALKLASQLKPSFAEQQQVAIGKLDSMENQIKDALSNSMKLSHGETTSSSYAENEDPLGLFGE